MENKKTELIDSAETLLEQVIDYRDQASAIDAKVKNQSDNYVPLDNLPYGEELIRTKEFPEKLEGVIVALDNENVSKEDIENAQELIEELVEALSDCTDLPSNDDDEF